MEVFSETLGFSSYKSYLIYLEDRVGTIIELDKKYNLNEDKVLNAISARLDGSSTGMSGGCNCTRINNNCLAGVLSASIIGHLGCATLDVTVIAGVICHSAVTIGHVAGSDNCNATAENCIRTCVN